MRTGIDARSIAVLAAIAAIAVSLAGCGARGPSLTFTPIPHPTSASADASGSASASPAASSATPSAAASVSGAVRFPDARHAVMAFTGTYKAQLRVLSATGAVAQNIGTSQDFVWHVTTACGGLCVHATSSSHATFTLKYAKDEFDGTGGGSSPCVDAAGQPTGKSFRTSLSITLKPGSAGTPIRALDGEEFLTVSGDCTSAGSSGSEVIQYALTRTGS
jgi:predicted small lipoprotein YifL